ncbi:hypothetical protein [Actinoplanes sp. NPDC051851]|uniref:hypothetical protein n=1 Tax=Actinoplanes sp. NPDC051851 TaxID=3154753 RepID=UPI003420BB72
MLDATVPGKTDHFGFSASRSTRSTRTSTDPLLPDVIRRDACVGERGGQRVVGADRGRCGRADLRGERGGHAQDLAVLDGDRGLALERGGQVAEALAEQSPV